MRLNIKQISERTGRPVRTIKALMDSGRLPFEGEFGQRTAAVEDVNVVLGNI